MQNLFASESRYRFVYWILWLVLGLIYAVLLFIIWGVEWQLAFLDSLVFTLIFAIIGIAVWYLVRFSGIDSNSILNTLISHLVAGGILVFFGIALGEMLIPLLFKDEAVYYSFSSEFHIYRLVIGSLLYILIAVYFYLIVYYEEYRSKKLRENELDKHLKTAELNMLKAQINPHFIFNSLNSVSSLTLTNPEKAHEMVIHLADFLRYSIRKNADQLVALAAEMEAIQLFLAIEKIRYGERLTIEFDCEDEAIQKLQLPALILQPIIENAIKYSLHETDLTSRISVKCVSQETDLLVIVTNNYDSEAVMKKGEGIGLKNVKSRLQLVYGSKDLLTIKDAQTNFEVRLRIPQL